MGADKNISLQHLLASNNWGNGIALRAVGTGFTVNNATTTGGSHSGAGSAIFTISSGSGVLVAYVGGFKASVTWATSDTSTGTALAAAFAASPPIAALVTITDNGDGTVTVAGIEVGAMVTGTATITSNAVDVRTLDDMSFQWVWSGGGSPVGTLDVQVSNDHQQIGAANVTNAGHWTSVTLAPAPAVSGNSGTAWVNLGALSAQYVRFVFTWGSGYGLLDCWFNGRSI